MVSQRAGVLVHGSVTNISIGLSPQIPVDKVIWLQDGNPFELGKVQEMFIPTDDTELVGDVGENAT